MRILVVGGGGREHALVWKLSQSPKVSALFCAPGNGGISRIASCEAIEPADSSGLLALARRERIDLVVIGPESALAAGVADVFEREGIRVFGPGRAGAQVETSKVFAKRLMDKYDIPTAPFKVFDDYQKASDYLRQLSASVCGKSRRNMRRQGGLCRKKGGGGRDCSERAVLGKGPW